MTRISIALCTYNGGKYLQEQLDSFAHQLHLPCELLVCDDQSTDNTWAILEKFAQNSPFPVRIYRNINRLGVSLNFSQAISLCTGEYIALADQDDVWVSHKLATFAKQFSQQPEIDALFSDAFIVDSQLKPLGYNLWDATGFTSTVQKNWHSQSPLATLLKLEIVTGATFVFSRRWLPLILPIPIEWLHDTWIATLIASVSNIGYLPEPLIYYRQHSEQLIGGQKRSVLNLVQRAEKTKSQGYEQRVLKTQKLLERLKNNHQYIQEKRALFWLENRYQHFKCRSELPNSRLLRFQPIFNELWQGRYHQFSAGWSSAFKDWLWG